MIIYLLQNLPVTCNGQMASKMVFADFLLYDEEDCKHLYERAERDM